jgi:hypothetical protein
MVFMLIAGIVLIGVSMALLGVGKELIKKPAKAISKQIETKVNAEK